METSIDKVYLPVGLVAIVDNRFPSGQVNAYVIVEGVKVKKLSINLQYYIKKG